MHFKTAVLFIFLALQSMSCARDLFRSHFIQSFLENEHRPNFVVYFDLCWSESEKVMLANTVSNQGSRVSSFKRDIDYEDNSLFLLDLDCSNANQLLELASSKKLFRQPHRWLVLTSSSEAGRLQTLWDCPILADSDLVLAERRDDQYVMVELHKPAINHTMISTPRGHYNGTLTDIRPRRELFRRRMDLMGHPLVMANVIQDSNSTMDHMEDELEFQYDGITKISWLNAKIGFLMLNATPRYVFSYRWGYKVNGQWSGMINDLHIEAADIGTNCLISDKERFSVVTYTDTLAPFNLRFIFRQPPLSYVANIYSLPFAANLWVGVAICAVGSAIAISVAARWERTFGRNSTSLDGGASDSVFWTMSALSQQGCDMEPRRTPGRIMQCVVFASLMCMYAAYSANIVVLLQAPSRALATLPQLAASTVTMAALEVDYSHFIFKQYKDPVHVAIRKKVDPEKGKGQFYHMNDGVAKIRQGLFAFHGISEPIYRRIEETFHENEKCDLAEIDYLNSFQPYAPIRKTSPHIELIRVVFKRIRETGVQSALSRRYQVPKPQCGQKAAAFSSVGIIDLKPVLLLMLIGCAVSVGILFAEIAVFHLTNKMKIRKAKKF